jgi:endonuclease-3
VCWLNKSGDYHILNINSLFNIHLRFYIFIITILIIMQTTNWPVALKPLLAKYKGKRHPLEYRNTYQLLVMVVLSAQDSDKHINSLAPALFKAFPNMKALAKADAEALYPFIGKVRNFGNKTNWLLKIANAIKEDKNIPLNLDALTQLPGIGRKSANVILREAGAKAEGVIVDLHVLRVAPRLGIATGTDPKKIEAQIMEVMPQNTWGEVGMAISFLGRETCRPKDPKHYECVVNKSCEYCQAMQGSKVASGRDTSRSATVKKVITKKAARGISTGAVTNAPAKKAAVKKTPVKKASVKKAPAKKAAKKVTAKKTAPKTSGTAVTGAAKKVAVKKTAVKKALVKKVAKKVPKKK